jgi:hypothetical protein
VSSVHWILLADQVCLPSWDRPCEVSSKKAVIILQDLYVPILLSKRAVFFFELIDRIQSWRIYSISAQSSRALCAQQLT